MLFFCPKLIILILLPILGWNKNRRKAIFNWAAKGKYFFWGEEAAIHTQATIKPCRRLLHETGSHVRLKHKLIQNIVPFERLFDF